MDIQDWGAIGEMIGGTATVATLIYLAIQIKEHTSLAKRQALDAIHEKASTWYAQLNANPELLDLYLDGKANFESFDERDQWRYHTLMMPMFAMFEGGLENSKDHAVKSEVVDAMHLAIARELEPPGANRWWTQMGRQYFSNDFSDLVDSLSKSTEISEK